MEITQDLELSFSVSTAYVYSDGVGTGIWEDLFNHRNSTPALHSFVFFSLVIFVYGKEMMCAL